MTVHFEPDNDEEIIYALRRARRALAALEIQRGSEDIERARKGAEHEVETALRLLGAPYVRPTARPVMPQEFLAAHEAFQPDTP